MLAAREWTPHLPEDLKDGIGMDLLALVCGVYFDDIVLEVNVLGGLSECLRQLGVHAAVLERLLDELVVHLWNRLPVVFERKVPAHIMSSFE